MIPEHEFYRMYNDEGMTQDEIAEVFGVSQSTIFDWIKKHGIETRTRSEAMLIKSRKPLREKLYDMYWVQKMSQQEIAKKIGASSPSVSRWMQEYGIEIRTSSKAQLNGNFTGEKSGGWRGGISGGKYCYKFNRQFREAVRERDDYICQLCGSEQNGRKLSIHHIHYDKENCYPNVVSLCHSCHSKVNGNRDYWEEYFENQLIERGLCCWSIGS